MSLYRPSPLRRNANDWRAIVNEREKYQAYLCSHEWGVLKEKVRLRSGGVCERCNFNKGDCVHHLTYARKYHEQLEDLQHICNGCHEFEHGKRTRDPRLDVPLKVMGTTIQKVYLAGRFSTQWRSDICRNWMKNSGKGTIFLDDGRSLVCVGPEFYQLGQHSEGAGPHQSAMCPDHIQDWWINKNHVLGTRLREILYADLVFCWLDDQLCFGTLAEIGFAKGLKTAIQRPTPLIVVARRPELADTEMWFAEQMANVLVCGQDAKSCWDKLLAQDFETPPLDDVYLGEVYY